MQVSQVVLWFTYTKAVINTLMFVMGLKLLQFKATDKKSDGASKEPKQETRLGALVNKSIKRLSSLLPQRNRRVGVEGKLGVVSSGSGAGVRWGIFNGVAQSC